MMYLLETFGALVWILAAGACLLGVWHAWASWHGWAAKTADLELEQIDLDGELRELRKWRNSLREAGVGDTPGQPDTPKSESEKAVGRESEKAVGRKSEKQKSEKRTDERLPQAGLTESPSSPARSKEEPNKTEKGSSSVVVAESTQAETPEKPGKRKEDEEKENASQKQKVDSKPEPKSKVAKESENGKKRPASPESDKATSEPAESRRGMNIPVPNLVIEEKTDPLPAPTRMELAELLESTFPNEPVKIDEQFGVLYTDHPSALDDLSEIKGIGPKTRARLNDLGVYRFKQIANWSPHHVQQFADRLDATEKQIKQDQWIPQARRLLSTVSDAETKASEVPSGLENQAVEPHPELGLVFTEAPDQKDDLKLLTGIGKVLENKLNQLGVYRHQQIALWTEAQQQEIARRLDIDPSYIAEDEWVEEARKRL